MTLKQYQRIKLAFVVVLAFFFSQAIYFKNYLVPIAVMIASALLLMFLRRRVKEVIADERDYETGGRAALLAIQIYGWAAAIGMFVLYALRETNPAYEAIAITLAFSTCALMLIYAIIFRYKSSYRFSSRKTLYIVFMIGLFLALAVASLRLLSGEDDWVCVEGNWQRHGNPSFPAPEASCE